MSLVSCRDTEHRRRAWGVAGRSRKWGRYQHMTHSAYRDFYRACLHEAAHTKVAHRLGYAGTHFRVWRTRSDAGLSEVAFTGRTYVFEETTADDARLICLAGAVAELLMDDYEPCAAVIQSYLERSDSSLSASDAAGAAGFHEADTRRVLELVRGCWRDIEREVDAMLHELGEPF